jgi:branched-chain amino acid aminotransferase
VSAPAPAPCLLDGVIAPDGAITLDAHGSLVAYGEGLFETLPVLDGSPCFLAAHLRRLDGACRELGLGAGPAERLVRDEIARLASAFGSTTFSLRVSVFRDGGRVRRLLVPAPIPGDVGHGVAVGVCAAAFDGPRPLARLKTLNYLVPRLAHQEGAARGFGEVLFTLPDGTVLEGTRSSVFMVREGSLVTPPLSLPILPGVTREVILDCARADGIPVREERFGLDALRAVDEAFLSASVRGVRPFESFEGRRMRVEGGAVTRRVRELYARALAAEKGR